MTIYHSRKSKPFIIIIYILMFLLVVSAILAGFGMYKETEVDIVQKVMITIFICISIFIAYSVVITLNSTFYTIDNNTLMYRSGLFRGNIEASSISVIQRSKYMSQGIRPALAFNGLKVTYQEGRRLFITPEDEEEFLIQVLEMNPKIVVKL